ncbi:MAG: undecaprenyl-diphosphate phosphatase [Humidesulfovibrio sp.]|uniref:undecaprenyl-diphosphate phosphatase n=1 Tax=Humidesulfovibrio sp. TaxID=2910988 RepID=UPI002735139E|nr:undecaprenyl-diphosphate phosphatase [Humidesulfovibrio sp.]MDP2847004.1 undecaprenyl-diphosphate phosphatase [Humidesulfovibrio sp.]
MAPWYVAVLMGLVEGLTEFLPVSSTGHLILAGHMLDLTGPKAQTFEVAIQLGAILSVVVLYRDRFMGLLRSDPARTFSGPRGILLLFLTSLPALILGFLVHHAIKTHLFGPRTVALAFVVGALMMFVVEARAARQSRVRKVGGLDSLNPGLALGIGCFQCLSLWPGFSRSGATIMGGMLLNVDRKTAAEYSFLAAVPVMCAAVGYDLLKNWRLFEADDLSFLAIGFVVSFIAGWAAVKGFIGLVSRMTLRPFALYRLACAPLIWFFWPA